MLWAKRFGINYINLFYLLLVRLEIGKQFIYNEILRTPHAKYYLKDLNKSANTKYSEEDQTVKFFVIVLNTWIIEIYFENKREWNLISI